MRATLPRALVLAVLLAAGCQPWYRDREVRGRLALDDRRTEHELEAAQAAQRRGDYEGAAAQLRATVRRSPTAGSEVWIALAEAEAAGHRPALARANVRWRLARLEASDPAATRLRAYLIGSLAGDGLVAQALDLVEPQTLDAALAHPALAPYLRDLGDAVQQARDPALAQLRLSGWLAAYGEPDHPILRAAREQIAEAGWDAAGGADAPAPVAGLRAWPGMVREELAAGNTEAALILYAKVYQLLPDAVADALRPDIERAAARAGITSLVPEIHDLAVAADAALKRGELGVATRRYRAVVVGAPWWTAARRNLDALDSVDRR